LAPKGQGAAFCWRLRLPISDTQRVDRLVIRRPDDWHVHLRDDTMLSAVVASTAEQFQRAIVMPNLTPPITTVAAARSYRERILAACPKELGFEPLMTCYLTNDTDPDEIARGHAEGVWVAAKLYPAGATTNSHHGVTDIRRIHKTLARMEQIGMPLLVHGESVDPEVDIFDREAVFLEETLDGLLRDFPGLKIVLEHVTTIEGVDFVRAHAERMGATITPHHLVLNRNALFQGGIRPHYYCLPIVKRDKHRLALRRAATSGESCFFLGTDSAPHTVSAKEISCGCAGCFVAPTALQTYAQVFEEEGALSRLEAFASVNGPRFYGLPLNRGEVTLVRQTGRTAAHVAVGDENVVIFRGDEDLAWSVERRAVPA
jgi:dihydroorotase